MQGLASLGDILITTALCFFLHRRRSGFRSSYVVLRSLVLIKISNSSRTEQIIDTLMMYAVSRGERSRFVFLIYLKKHFRRYPYCVSCDLLLYTNRGFTIHRVIQILFLVLNVAYPHDTYWMPFHQTVGKVSSYFKLARIHNTLFLTCCTSYTSTPLSHRE